MSYEIQNFTFQREKWSHVKAFVRWWKIGGVKFLRICAQCDICQIGEYEMFAGNHWRKPAVYGWFGKYLGRHVHEDKKTEESGNERELVSRGVECPDGKELAEPVA